VVISIDYNKISETEKQKKAEICLKCGVCCVIKGYSCPAQYGKNNTPQKTYVYSILKNENPLDDPNIWTCMSCHKCEEMCPYEVSPVNYIEYIKQLAVIKGKAPNSIYEEINQISQTGYAFPVTPNTKRRRTQIDLDEIEFIDEIQIIAKKTGLKKLLEGKL
jgi:heterodisulfide reductase subunit C